MTKVKNKAIDTNNNGEVKQEIKNSQTRDGISNNSIKFLAYDSPVDLKQEWIEFRFVPQGNGTAKIKYFFNGKILNPNDIKDSLALYYRTMIKLNNIYGGNHGVLFGRGMKMREVAQSLENLTFTYNVDAFLVFAYQQLMPPNLYFLQDENKMQDEGIVGIKFDGTIHANLANRDFNQDLRFSATRELYRFRVRQDGLYAEYMDQVKFQDGEYYIESISSPGKFISLQSESFATLHGAGAPGTSQRINLKYNNILNAYEIILKSNNSFLTFSQSGKYIRFLKNISNGDSHWYLKDAGHGKYILVSAKDIYKAINENSNDLEATKTNNGLNQQFKFIKAIDPLEGYKLIVSKLNNNKVLNLDKNNDNLTIADVTNNNNQGWIFRYDIMRGAYNIGSRSSQNKTLKWDRSNNNVIATQHMPQLAEHFWVLEDVGEGYYIFKNYANDNMVLDLKYGSTENGANIEVYNKHYGDNQKFKILSDNDLLGEVVINSKLSDRLNRDKVLDVNNDTSHNNVTIWTYGGGNNQRWKFEYHSNKAAYKIRSVSDKNKVLARVNGTGSNVFTYNDISSASDQYWVLENTGDGHYIIKNYENQNMVLDLNNSNTINGSNIEVHPRNNGDNQKWRTFK